MFAKQPYTCTKEPYITAKQPHLFCNLWVRHVRSTALWIRRRACLNLKTTALRTNNNSPAVFSKQQPYISVEEPAIFPKISLLRLMHKRCSQRIRMCVCESAGVCVHIDRIRGVRKTALRICRKALQIPKTTALYIRRRALYMPKTALQIRERALFIRKRAQHIIKRALHLHKSALYILKRSLHFQNSHVYPLKSPTYPQHSLM